MPMSKPTPKGKPVLSGREAIAVSVLLSPEDHKNATAVTKIDHQTLAEWVSSLVNTALQP